MFLKEKKQKSINSELFPFSLFLLHGFNGLTFAHEDNNEGLQVSFQSNKTCLRVLLNFPFFGEVTKNQFSESEFEVGNV